MTDATQGFAQLKSMTILSRPRVVALTRRTFLAGGISFACVPISGWSQTDIHALRAASTSLDLLANGRPKTAASIFRLEPEAQFIKLKRGIESILRLSNDLPAPIHIQWYGLRAQTAANSFNLPMVAYGKSADLRILPRDAGTFWFRALPARHALHGALIVDETEPPQVDRDFAFLLDDWRLHDDGSIEETAAIAVLTANNIVGQDIRTNANERVRLRFVNAGARVFNLRIERHDLRVMAIDGQPAQPFLAREGRLALAPGNRIDVFVDMALPPGSIATIFAAAADQEVALARLVYGATAARLQPLPEPVPLPANRLPEKIDLAGSQKTEIGLEVLPSKSWRNSFSLDGQAVPPLFSVRRGRSVTLALANRTASPRVLHMQGHHVRLLDRLDDGWKPFWLDTILVEAGATSRVAFVAEGPGRWLIESRALNKRDDSQYAWFEVT
jgi:FtsP/CotA-like multicopper oxidase with cupredoxin domain